MTAVSGSTHTIEIEERDRVDQERGSRLTAPGGDEPPADRGADHAARPPGGRTGRASSPGCRSALGHELRARSRRRPGRRTRCRRRRRGRDEHDVPDSGSPGDRRGRRGSHTLTMRSASAAIITLRRSNRSLTDAAHEQEDDLRHGHRDAHDRERRRRVRELVDLPRERHVEDAVAEQRRGHPGPEEPEVAVPQRPGCGTDANVASRRPLHGHAVREATRQRGSRGGRGRRSLPAVAASAGRSERHSSRSSRPIRDDAAEPLDAAVDGLVDPALVLEERAHRGRRRTSARARGRTERRSTVRRARALRGASRTASVVAPEPELAPADELEEVDLLRRSAACPPR